MMIYSAGCMTLAAVALASEKKKKNQTVRSKLETPSDKQELMLVPHCF
jgi:hypothetical protein